MPEYQEGSGPQNGLPAEQAAPSQEQVTQTGEQQEVDAAQLKAQLEAARQENERILQERNTFETRFKDTQSAYTQTRQQLAALTGVEQQQKQVNPVDQYASQFIERGLLKDPKTAKDFAEIMHGMIAPLQQQNQYLYAAMQNTTQVNSVLESAFQKDPTLFQDPEIAAAIKGAVQQEAMQAAQQGMPINPEAFTKYALSIGAQERYFRQLNLPPNQQQQATRPAQNTQSFGSMSGIANGMNMRPAPAQAQKQYAPGQQELAQKMEEQLKAFGGKK